MKVRSLYQSRVVSVEPWNTLMEAARLMRKEDSSAVAVMSRGNLVGILTERDLTECIAYHQDLEGARVAQHMHRQPVTVDLDDETDVAATRMLAVGCRHLPVMDGDRIVGMVSVRDLLPLAAAPVIA